MTGRTPAFLVTATLAALPLAPTAGHSPSPWQVAEDGQRCMMLLPPAEDRVTLVSLAGAHDTPGMVLMMLVSPLLPRIGSGLHGTQLRLGTGTFTGQMMVRDTGKDTPVVAAMPLPVSALKALADADQVEFRVGGRRYTAVTLPERAAMTDHLRRCLAKLTSAKPTAKAAPVLPADPLAAAEAAGLKVSQPHERETDQNADVVLRDAAQAGVFKAQSDTLLMMMRINNHLITGGSMADPNLGSIMMGLEY